MQVTRPRVMLVEAAPRMTGSVRSISSAVAVLREDFDFVLAGGSPEVADAIGVPWRRFEFAMPRKKDVLTFGPRVLWQARKFKQLIEREKPDLVHVNDLTNIVPIVARWLGAKSALVYHLRLLPTSYVGSVFAPLTRLILANADRVVCVSQAVRDSLPRAAQVAVVHNGLPVRVVPDGMSVTELASDAPGAHETVDVIYLGHFHPGKGQDLALEAFARAAPKVPSLRLRFVGSEKVDPAFALKVRAMAQSLGVIDRVLFAGPTESPGPELRRADIVLNLSESESFSMVVLEGMMNGRPVIASRCGGPDELLRDASSGVLVPNRDVGAAADALVSLAQSAELRRKMGQRAREVAVQRFDVRATAAELAAIYRDALR